MPVFNPSKPNLAHLKDVESLVEDGSLAQYRGTGIISRWIQYATTGCHSHSAMIRRNGRGCDVLQIREFQGGSARPLESEVNRYPGMIDVFTLDLERWPEFNVRGALKYMRDLTGRDYGYWGVAHLALLRIPYVRRLWRFTADDARDSDSAPFCSHAVASAYRIGGGIDPVPRTPDDLVSPAHLTTSMLFKYQFTLIP